jgi:hypothetical protein
MSDELTAPFLWQTCEVPPLNVSGTAQVVRQVNPPPGYMLHSWQVAALGQFVICWVRMPRDAGAELGAMLWDMTRTKEPKG